MATSITASTFASVTVDAGGNSPDSAVSNFDSLSATANLISNFGASSAFTGSASANAAFGLLKVSASADITDYAQNSYAAGCTVPPVTFCGPSGSGPVLQPATSFASFTDAFTLTGGAGTAYIVLTFAIDGSSSFTSSDASVEFNSGAQGNLTIYDGALFAGPMKGSFGFFGGNYVFHSDPIAVTYGVAHTVTVATGATVSIIDTVSAGPYSASGSADFGHTISLSSIAAFSDAGATAPVSFSLTANSGTSYVLAAAPGAATPEPATWMMFGGGFLVVGLARGRRLLRSL